ncbi:hypothetical protein LPTSP4_00040 [Leptospira ryugenii]|uniref:Cyclic nucleotide-binding domain-containing protein n=1 Tax=Leptospira ryugenii TaxID=1917863 RepID=A0A2P2DV68_9LEPT|nr:cyclic nucleotide-binding domain-containing protein [Leptospira ryugenii]GBF48505.1 hypothetical protein LPTSP4_00040 [Leptospira ryugenii]
MSFFEDLHSMNLVGKQYQAGEAILTSGESTDIGVGLVLKGRVRNVPNFDGVKSAQEFYEKGMFFGLAGLISKSRLMTFQADIDGTYVLFLTEDVFQKSLLSDEKFLAQVLQSSLQKLEAIPSSDLVYPDRPVDFNELFGEGSENQFKAIRERNLAISNYIYKLRNRTAYANESIFQDDNLDDSDIYMLIEGTVLQYVRDSENPNQEHQVIALQPGALFGFLRKAGNKGHYLSARAGSEGAKLIHLDSDLLMKVTKLDVKLAWSIFLNFVLTVAVIEKTMLKR